MRTTDRGATWQDVTPPGAAGLQFRDIEAFDAIRRRRHVDRRQPGRLPDLPHARRRATGHRRSQNSEPTALLRLHDFFDQPRGLALSDPPDGSFRVLATDDGGRDWHVTGLQMPAALPGEAGFAASGECLTYRHGRRAWFGTAAPPRASSAPTTAAPPGRSRRHRSRAARPQGSSRSPSRDQQHGSRSAATSSRRRLTRQLRPHLRWRAEWSLPREGRRIPLGRVVGRRPHGDRGRPSGSDVSTDSGRPGSGSTAAASTLSIARTRTPAGPPVRPAALRT